VVALGLATGGGALLACPALLDEKAEAKSEIAGGKNQGQPAQPARPKFPPGRVDLAGDPLPEYAVSRLGSTRFVHGLSVQSMRISPDQKKIISASMDGIRCWDLHTGKELYAHAGEKYVFGWPGWASEISPDGRLLLTPASTGINSYDVETGASLASFGKKRYSRAIVSPSGKQVAALSLEQDASVDLLDLETGRLIWSSGRYDYPMAWVRFSDDGKTIVVAGWSTLRSPPLPGNSLRILDSANGVERCAIDLGEAAPREIAISPQGTLVSAICYTRGVDLSRIANEIRIWDTVTGKEIDRIEPPPPASKINSTRSFSALQFTPDGKGLLTAGNSDELILWHLAPGKEQRRLGHGLGNASHLVFSGDGKTLVAAAGQRIQVLDFLTGRHATTSPGASPNPVLTSFSSDGSTVATAGGLGDNGSSQVIYWETNTGKELRRSVIPDSHVCGITNSATTAIIEHLGGPKSLFLRELDSGTDRKLSTEFAGGNQNAYATSASGRTFAIADSEKDVIAVFDAQTGASIHSLGGVQGGVRHLRFAADERRLFAFSPDQTVRIWDLVSGKNVGQYTPTKIPDNRPQVTSPFPAPNAANAFPPFEVALSPDAKSIALAEVRDFILLWDASDGRNDRRVNVGPVRPRTLTFSPDSKLLLWASWDEPNIHLLDVASGKEVRQLAGHRGLVYSLAFSPDGQRLVSSNSDGTALVWDFSKILKDLH
jgi:WD40 repeat protein